MDVLEVRFSRECSQRASFWLDPKDHQLMVARCKHVVIEGGIRKRSKCKLQVNFTSGVLIVLMFASFCQLVDFYFNSL